MNFFQEYSLLIAIAVPSLAILGVNAFLMLTGEEGTLLLPSFRRYPPIRTTTDVSPAGAAATAPLAANEEFEREVA